jgi:hypothetical protein
VDALVLVGDVEKASVAGDRNPFDARQGRELAHELGFEGAGVTVRRDRAAEVGRYRISAARVVLREDALSFPAVYVAGDEVQFVADDGEVADAGHLAVPAYGVHDPEAFYLRQPVSRLEEAFDAFEFDEDRPSVGGYGETQAEQKGAVGAERRALEVEG